LQIIVASPKALFLVPTVLEDNANLPTALFNVPVVLLLNAQKPTAVLFEAVLQSKE